MIASSLSVIAQRVYFKLTGGKRLIKMSPIHHHFEMSGWTENTIARRYTLVVAALSLVAALAALPGWSVDDGALRKAYRFADWRATMAFVNAVAGMADRVDHHPELNVGWGRCTVAWRTHDADGITQNDLACAARTDALARPAGAAEGTG